MSEPVNRLGLQELGAKSLQALVVAQLAAAANADGWFSTREVAELFERLRVPAPGNLAQELSRLQGKGELYKRARKPPWSLTPGGEQRVLELMGQISDAPAVVSQGVDLEGGQHLFIPPGLAPKVWLPALGRLNQKFPFERNIFLITRYPTRDDDVLTELIKRAKKVCEAHGFHMLRADAQHADPILPNNVFAHMWASQYGLALMEAFGDPPVKPAAINDNLIFEVGSMLMIGRRCAIVKDTGVTKVPTDMSAHIRHTVSFADPDAAEAVLHQAMVKDFDSVPCAACPNDV
jgi:hypothetical protein